jgi:2',3'-cyclic-nucleotide 2'-phosphodiesterase (5'-nucleotidase family)
LKINERLTTKQENMKRLLLGIAIAAICYSCAHQQYTVTNIQAQRYPVALSNNLTPNNESKMLVSKYKALLDNEMGTVIGSSSQDMKYAPYESLLNNLTTDVMLKYTRSSFAPDCDLSIMNVNGHRSNLAKGNITVGNVFEIYSFENSLALLKVSGDALWKVFEAGIEQRKVTFSSSVRLTVRNKKLESASINGKPLDKNKLYSIVTLDYLAEGNDSMDALKEAKETEQTGIALRDVMLDYIKNETKAGHEITSQLDGRVTFLDK